MASDAWKRNQSSFFCVFPDFVSEVAKGKRGELARLTKVVGGFRPSLID